MDESYPSDHGTFVWYNPPDQGQRIEVVGSGCAGCVSTLTGPEAYNSPVPSGGLPDRTLTSVTVTPCQMDFTASFAGDDLATPTSLPASSLPDTGRVEVSRLPGGRITGYARVDVWLPDAQAGEARQIADSLTEALTPGATVC